MRKESDLLGESHDFIIPAKGEPIPVVSDIYPDWLYHSEVELYSEEDFIIDTEKDGGNIQKKLEDDSGSATEMDQNQIIYTATNSQSFFGRVLSGRQREIIEMIYGDNMTISEVSNALSISKAAVRKSIRGGLKKLEMHRSFRERNGVENH